ncbi:hypothetical protein AOH328_00240 [Helicobacter pylori]
MKVPAQNTMNRPSHIKAKRKIVQIAISKAMGYDHNDDSFQSQESLIALCDDGTVWSREFDCAGGYWAKQEWKKIEDIPQDEDVENDD